MTTNDGFGHVLIWDLRAGRPIGRPRSLLASGILSAPLSPDGRTLAVLVSAGGIALHDAATLRSRAVLPGSEKARFFAQFTADGRHVVADGGAGQVRVWSAETGRPTGRFLVDESEDVVMASMSRDDRMLATGSTDGTVRLFDVGTERPLGVPLPGLPGRPAAPLFTPDGAHLLAMTSGGPSYRWDVRPSAWMRHACDVAGRRLTRSEWAEVLPGRPYAPACG
jgi:WD40 repeat protein